MIISEKKGTFLLQIITSRSIGKVAPLTPSARTWDIRFPLTLRSSQRKTSAPKWALISRITSGLNQKLSAPSTWRVREMTPVSWPSQWCKDMNRHVSMIKTINGLKSAASQRNSTSQSMLNLLRFQLSFAPISPRKISRQQITTL